MEEEEGGILALVMGKLACICALQWTIGMSGLRLGQLALDVIEELGIFVFGRTRERVPVLAMLRLG